MSASDAFGQHLGATLGFWMTFCTPLDFEGGPKITCLDIEANTMIKNGVLDRVLKLHQFSMGSQYQNEVPEMVKQVFLHYACYNLRGLGGYEI